MEYRIRAPQHNGTVAQGKEEIGLAERNLEKNNFVKILLKNRHGDLVYPNKYYISGYKAIQYRSTTVKGTKLRMVPLKDMTKLKSKDSSDNFMKTNTTRERLDFI